MSRVIQLQHDLGIDESKHALSLLRKLERLRNSTKQCDLIIKVGKEELHVHRNVMMAGSDFFDAMFSHDTQENRSGVVEMKEVPFSILKKCIIFIYTGRFHVIEEECEEVLYVASMLLLTEVCGKVAPFLGSQINPSSFFNIKRIALKFDLDNLNKLCDDFALKNFDQIVKKEEFGQLELEYVSFLIRSRKDLNIGSEDERLELILQWIKADVKNHQQHLVSMMTMSLLDLGEVSESVISNLVENEPLCYESGTFMKLLYLVEKNKPKFVAALPSDVSCSSCSGPNAIIVFDKSSKSLQAFRPETKSWTKLHDLPYDMLGDMRYTSVVMGERLYVLMENKRFFRINYLWKYCCWFELNQMILQHGSNLRATVCDDCIYVAGKNSMERYSEKEGHWIIVQNSGASCNYRSLVTCRNRIYSIGGRNSGASKGVSMFSPDSLAWVAVTPMANAVQTCAATVIDDMIYVAGGYFSGESLNDFQLFDLDADEWIQLDTMVETRNEFCLCVVHGMLFAVGNKEGPLSIEMYNFKTRLWKIVEGIPNMEIEPQASTAALLPGHSFC